MDQFAAYLARKEILELESKRDFYIRFRSKMIEELKRHENFWTRLFCVINKESAERDRIWATNRIEEINEAINNLKEYIK